MLFETLGRVRTGVKDPPPATEAGRRIQRRGSPELLEFDGGAGGLEGSLCLLGVVL